ncbi:MAG: hypothetical protein ACK5AJ_04455 [bacterium]|jgi:soluble cytochrome b562|nr:hypothetical protein [Oxalobacteraceae bacterium]
MKNATRSLLHALVSGLMLTAAVGHLPARAEDEDSFKCISEDEKECAFENESMALFIKGRDAYDKGRETGDLSQARTIAQELVQRKNKYGKRMMKMIYMQLATGTHKNFVEAYRWLQEGIAKDEKYSRLDLNRVIDQLSAKMTPEQLAEAQKK